jgi:threonine/homoserine/homoserine lactone efflux protein
MLAALLTVITASLSGVMAPGPMFTVTLAKSLKSPWTGVQIALGHAVLEVPLIALIYFGVAHFLQNGVVQIILSVLGGGMIIWMGADMFRTRRKIVSEGKEYRYNAFTAGILMSGLNPFFLVWWVTAGSLILMNFLQEVGTWGLPFFVLVHWACDLVWLSFVSVLIYRTHRFWGQKIQELVFLVLGVLLAYFGGQFIIKGIDTYFTLTVWNWARWIFWAAGIVFIVFWVYRYLRRGETKAAVSS